MAITVYENKEAGGARVKLDRRVCQTTAGELVEADHRDAATLYASAGKEVPRAEFEALGGVVKSTVKAEPAPVAKPKAEPKPEAKRKTTKKAAKRKTTKKGK